MYIESSLFWGVVICLGIGIIVVYCVLSNKIEKLNKNLYKQITEVRNESLRGEADILIKMADSIGEETPTKKHAAK